MENNNLRIKVDKLSPKATKDALLLTLATKINTPVNRIFNTTNGFIILCKKKDADKIISNEGEKILYNNGFKLKIAADIIAKKTLIIRRIDPDIGSKDKEEIKEEIQNINKVKILEVIKIPDRNNFFKIIFHTIEDADKIQESGFNMFHMSVAKHQMERETFYKIITCFNCYEHNNHTTTKCPHPKKTICSTCAKEGHFYTECKAERKNCLNCGGEHHALALICPKKREIIQQFRKEKRDQIKEWRPESNTNRITYAQAITQKYPTENKTENNTGQNATIILTAIIDAHLKNITFPGTYDTELNKNLKKNNLPIMKTEENPNSAAIIMALQSLAINKEIRKETPTILEREEIIQNKNNQQNTEVKEADNRENSEKFQIQRNPKSPLAKEESQEEKLPSIEAESEKENEEEEYTDATMSEVAYTPSEIAEEEEEIRKDKERLEIMNNQTPSERDREDQYMGELMLNTMEQRIRAEQNKQRKRKYENSPYKTKGKKKYNNKRGGSSNWR